MIGGYLHTYFGCLIGLEKESAEMLAVGNEGTGSIFFSHYLLQCPQKATVRTLGSSWLSLIPVQNKN
jgi:hypothetical protein